MTETTKNPLEIIDGGVPATAPIASVESIGRQINERIALMDKIHALLQQRIDPKRDITNMGGKFRRTINFARVCRRVIGGDVTFRRDPATDLPYKRTNYKDDAGDYYTYTCSCLWRLPWGEVVEGVSLVSSRDKFFGIEDDEFKDPADVNEASIAQKSVTEAFKQAVFVGLGLPKDVTAEELAKYGVDGGAASGHNFDNGRGNSGGSKATTQDSRDKRAELESMCREMFAGGWKIKGAMAATPEDMLRIVTENPDKGWGGWKNFKGISEKALNMTHAEVSKAFDEFQKAQGQE